MGNTDNQDGFDYKAQYGIVTQEHPRKGNRRIAHLKQDINYGKTQKAYGRRDKCILTKLTFGIEGIVECGVEHLK